MKKNNPNLVNQNINEHWLSARVFVLLATMFVITQVVGLFIANELIKLGITSGAFTEDINDPLNAVFLFGIIIVMTVVILLALKYKRQTKFLWLVEGLAIFSTSIVVFGAIFPYDDLLVLIIALFILVYRYTHKENVWFRNFVSMIAIIGAGAIIGISIGVLPILLFIIILAAYDMIAVFGTKHMVTLGKAVTKKNFAFTVAMPTKKHTFELGNGDLVIPLITASSVFANGWFVNNLLVAGLVLIASFIGLFLSIYIVGTKKISLPALPPQTILMIIVIGLALLFGL
jgi:presenilin-like A22 family membrane protease